ncbi:MAG: WecB/TagA/CpsF family glycosyltransferase [Victivallaceae bacterium]|nr:WecB/TagA/CpsF family glycosyltransferase [Victivallaceae bacterium]
METLKVRGIKIESSCYADAIDDLAEAIAAKKGGYVCFVEAKLFSNAVGNNTLTGVLNKSLHTYPDGISVALCASLRARHKVRRIPGPSYMLMAIERGLQPRWRHFFCGGTPGEAEKMAENFKERFPEIEIAGTFCPSFGVIPDAEDKALQKAISETSPDIVWVALGGGRQDLFMYNRRKDFPGVIMAGVGAAFDFHSGERPWAPEWLRKIGMEWVWRTVSGGWDIFFKNIKCVSVAGWYLLIELVKFPFKKQSAEIPEAAEISEEEKNAIATMGNWISDDGTAACSDETYDFLEKHSLEQLAYFHAKDSLTEGNKEKAEAKHRNLSQQDVKQQEIAGQVANLLEDRNIRFCMIKGSDLAVSVYPSGALRYRCDIDILVHSENIRRADEILRRDGWTVARQINTEDHYPVLVKDGVYLELHKRLPLGGKCKNDTVWKLLRNENGSRFSMPLEIALITTFNHARKHAWQDGPKMLVDLAYIAKKLEKIDWNEIRKASMVCGAMSPEIAFLVFPELFPENTIPKDSEVSIKARELFADVVLHAPKLLEHQAELVMLSHDRFSRDWWMRRLAGFAPEHIRLITENPRGNYLKLIKGYFQVAGSRIAAFFKYITTASTPEIDTFLRKSSALDKGI